MAHTLTLLKHESEGYNENEHYKETLSKGRGQAPIKNRVSKFQFQRCSSWCPCANQQLEPYSQLPRENRAHNCVLYFSVSKLGCGFRWKLVTPTLPVSSVTYRSPL